MARRVCPFSSLLIQGPPSCRGHKEVALMLPFLPQRSRFNASLFASKETLRCFPFASKGRFNAFLYGKGSGVGSKSRPRRGGMQGRIPVKQRGRRDNAEMVDRKGSVD